MRINTAPPRARFTRPDAHRRKYECRGGRYHVTETVVDDEDGKVNRRALRGQTAVLHPDENPTGTLTTHGQP
jgi:hypothetical protein